MGKRAGFSYAEFKIMKMNIKRSIWMVKKALIQIIRYKDVSILKNIFESMSVPCVKVLVKIKWYINWNNLGTLVLSLISFWDVHTYGQTDGQTDR